MKIKILVVLLIKACTKFELHQIYCDYISTIQHFFNLENPHSELTASHKIT